jgi:hypothetical protein
MAPSRRELLRAWAAASALAGLALPVEELAARCDPFLKRLCRCCLAGCGLPDGRGSRLGLAHVHGPHRCRPAPGGAAAPLPGPAGLEPCSAAPEKG